MTRQLQNIPFEGLRYGSTHINVEVCYSKGTSAKNPRGYYLRVTPVEHKNGMVSFNILSVVSRLLMQTQRYSAKQFEQAVKMGLAVAPELVKLVIEQERAA